LNPEISVIIPYYRGERWLDKAVDSVRRQEGVSWELLIVDDGSPDPARRHCVHLDDERIRLVEKENGGKGATVNRGIRESRAGVFCVLDQDDLMLPGRLAKQFAIFVKNPVCDAVFSDYERVREDGTVIDRCTGRQATNREYLHALAGGKGLFSMQTLLMKKSGVLAIGGFCEDRALSGLDDGEFFVRLLVSGCRLIYEPGLAGRWVDHGDNFSKTALFQEARKIFIDKLDALARNHAEVAGELPRFRAHHHFMSGVYYLERNEAGKARCEFKRMMKATPFDWNAYYLFFKAVFRQIVPSRQVLP
jgi:glycosyltransferase involved in cell wall biosynthesis